MPRVSIRTLFSKPATRRLILGAYVAVMLAALLMPVPATPSYVPGDFDKVAHVGLFLGFAALVAWNARGGRQSRALGAVAWAVAFAGLTEVLQSLLPYRSGDPMDLVAGVAGAIVGAVLGAQTGTPTD
jgi:VanZ family protein